MTNNKKLFSGGMALLILLLTMGVGSAADESLYDAANAEGGGRMKITTSTFTDGMSWDQIAPLMPVASLILLFLAFVYGLSTVSALFASGIKGNIGVALKNTDLRNEGHRGNVSVLGGLLLMAVSFVLMFLIWNNYGFGAW